MDNPKRVIGIFGTVVLWGLVGLITLLRVGKSIYLGQTPEIMDLLLCLVALLTVASSLSGDKIRRGAVVLWGLEAAVGLIFLILGAGLDIQWMVEKSVGMIMTGLIAAYLLVLPDSK